MSFLYRAPDVYVQEVSGGARPIEAVGTSTAGFVGVAPNANAPQNIPIAINNWTEFIKNFVEVPAPPAPVVPTPQVAATSGAKKGTTPAAAKAAAPAVPAAPATITSTALSHAVFGFFLNGGTRCYVVNVGNDASGKPNPISSGGTTATGVDVLDQIDEVAIVAAPGYTDAASYEAVISHCERLKDRVGILDAPGNVTDTHLLTQVEAAPVPGGQAGQAAPAGLRPRQSDGGYATFYFPWIVVRDPLSIKGDLVNVPPSGHLAGIWARTDATIGVHKAPANEPILGALNVTYRLTRAEQEELNPAGVNCIRFFTREGIRVWGARTLADSASEWRYLNVRRLFNMIEESIATETRWIVFEPNDRTLWKSVRRDITAFLMRLWRDGALMGATPQQAFFVKCDEETNPPDVVDAGQVVTLIGIAPVKPAEFVVFRISQYAAGTDTDTAGGTNQ